MLFSILLIIACNGRQITDVEFAYLKSKNLKYYGLITLVNNESYALTWLISTFMTDFSVFYVELWQV
jgi:hypothetical protein